MSTFEIRESISEGRRGLAQMINSRDCGRAAAALPAGVVVVPSSEDDFAIKVPASAADVAKALGVSEYLALSEEASATNEYAEDQVVNYVRSGKIFAISEESAARGGDVYVRFAAKGANTQLGAVRTDADGDGPETVEVTIVSDDDGAVFHLTINDTLFEYVSGSSETQSQKATAFAALVDAEDGFGAAAVAAVVTITPVSGQADVTDASPDSLATWEYGADADAPTCALLVGAKFDKASSGAGIALLDLK
jgi:hypothetical protein